MIKKLYTRSRIFFKNPHVVRVVFLNAEDLENTLAYVRENIKGTWGFSSQEYQIADDISRISTIVFYCFADKQDALQFIIASKSFKSSLVKLWPSKLLFTITEYDYDSEDDNFSNKDDDL